MTVKVRAREITFSLFNQMRENESAKIAANKNITHSPTAAAAGSQVLIIVVVFFPLHENHMCSLLSWSSSARSLSLSLFSLSSRVCQISLSHAADDRTKEEIPVFSARGSHNDSQRIKQTFP